MSAAKKRPELSDFVRTKSEPLRALMQTVEKVLDHDVNILLLGESGVGKDFLAEAIHACGTCIVGFAYDDPIFIPSFTRNLGDFERIAAELLPMLRLTLG